MAKRLAALTAAVALVGGVTAVAETSPDTTASRVQGPPRAVPATMSASASSVLSVLRDTGPATNLPDAVGRTMSEGAPARVYGTNPGLTRAVTAPPGAGARPWYLVPGNDSVCLDVGEAGACATVDEIKHGGLAIYAIDDPGPAPDIIDGQPVATTAPAVRNPRMRIMGVAPDGVTAVTAVSADGPVRAAVENNTYVLQGRGLVDVSLVHSDGSSTAIQPR
jgi:hypothetical protein